MTPQHFSHSRKRAGSWLAGAIALVWLSQMATGQLAALPMAQTLPEVFTDTELLSAGGLFWAEIVRLEGAEVAAAAGRGLLIAATAALLLLVPRFALYRAAGRWSAAPVPAETRHKPAETRGKPAGTRGNPVAPLGAFLRFCFFWAIQVLFAVALAVLAWMTRRLSLELGWQGLAPSLVIAVGSALLLLLVVTWLELGRLAVCLSPSLFWVHALGRAVETIRRTPHLLALRCLKSAAALGLVAVIAQSGSAATLVTSKQLVLAQVASLLLVLLDGLWLAHAARRLPPGGAARDSGGPSRIERVARDPQAAAMT